MSRPRLSDDEVIEILRLRREEGHTLIAIAKQFKRGVQTISLIIHGKTYRHITTGDAERLRERRRRRNAAIAATAVLTGVCIECGVPAPVKATVFLSRPELVLCAKHDRRRLVPETVEPDEHTDRGSGE